MALTRASIATGRLRAGIKKNGFDRWLGREFGKIPFRRIIDLRALDLTCEACGLGYRRLVGQPVRPIPIGIRHDLRDYRMRIDLIAVKPLVIEGCGVPEIEKPYLAFMSEGVPLEQ